MMSWVSALPALLAALAIATLPGLPLAWALRLRGFTLVAGSIAASFAVIGLVSIIAAVIGVPWGILPVLATALVLTLLALAARRYIPSFSGVARSSRALVVAPVGAILLAAALIAFEITRAIGHPGNISQTYDGVFHLNAVAQILATTDASPFHMNLASPAMETGFYPTLWHASVALIAQLSDASVPVATNALALVVATWVWPVAILFFGRPFFIKRPAHYFVGAVLAAMSSAFPYLLLTWGVLYPNFLANALLPLAIGFLHLALRHRRVGIAVPAASLWIAFAGAAGASALAHPNAVFGLVVLSIPLLIAVAKDIRSSDRTLSEKLWRWGALAAVLLGYLVLFATVTTAESRRYDSSVFSAFTAAIANAPLVDARAWFLSILVLSGVVVLLLRRRDRWLVAAYAATIFLFSVTMGLDGPIRDFITGAWYNDAARVAALIPNAAIPLAGAAAAKLLDFVDDGLRAVDPRQLGERTRRALPHVGALVVIALLLTGSRSSSLAVQSGWMHELYVVSDNSALLSSDEIALLERLDAEVPEDALIAGDPWTGTGLAFALSDRRVLFPHLKGNFSNAAVEFAAEFNDMGAASCPLLEELGVDYVLDFGHQRYDIGDPATSTNFNGLRDVRTSPVLTEVDREGDAALFRVTC